MFKVRGEQSPCSCIRKALMLTAVATKSLKIVIFNHLMRVDANDSVTIPRCPNLGCGLESECGTEKKNFARILGTPLFEILDPPLGGGGGGGGGGGSNKRVLLSPPWIWPSLASLVSWVEVWHATLLCDTRLHVQYLQQPVTGPLHNISGHPSFLIRCIGFQASTTLFLLDVIPSVIRSSTLLSGASLNHSQMYCSDTSTTADGLTEQVMLMDSIMVVGVGMLGVPL